MGCLISSKKINTNNNTINFDKKELMYNYEKYKNVLHNLSIQNSTTIFKENKYSLAKIIEIYDGDTITVAIICNNLNYKIKCRLNRIDAPELKCNKNNINRELEKLAATKVKNYLITLLLNRIIIFQFIKYDKYGRALVEIETLEHINISSFLIKKNIVKEYDGKEKKPFSINELKYIINFFK